MSDPNDWNKQVIDEFQANEGKVGGYFENTTLVLLHTTGAKSGLKRINPLVCLPEDDRLFIFASKAGADSNPDWYYNILANPNLFVEYGIDKFDARAIVLDEPERTEIYNKVAAKHENFAEYAEKTTRTIPVIELIRL